MRIDRKPLAVDEVEAEQKAVQIRVRKGPVHLTEEQVMKQNATHLLFRDWCVHCIAGKASDWPHSQIHPFFDSDPDVSTGLFLSGDTDTLTVLNCLHCPSGATHDIHGCLGAQEDGLMPCQRLKGKSSSRNLAEFGEQVYVKDPNMRHGKLDDRCIGPVTVSGTRQSQRTDVRWSSTGRYDGFHTVNGGGPRPWQRSR